MNNLRNSSETESAINIMELNAFSESSPRPITNAMNFAADIKTVEENLTQGFVIQ